MSTMKTKLRSVALATLFIGLSAIAQSATFTKTDGSVFEGDVEHMNKTEVTLKTSVGEIAAVPFADFDAASKAAIDAWAAENPDLVGVYAQWDTKPVVTRSRNAVTPPALNAPGFHGLVSLNVVLDEQGKVSWAEVSKSTHSGLEDAALEAIRSWAFKPAKIQGHAVKARIAISFKFES